MREQVKILSSVGAEPLTDVVSRLAAELKERRQGTADSDSPSGIIGLLLCIIAIGIGSLRLMLGGGIL